MRTLPTTMVQALASFAPLFSERVWQHALVVLAGTILAPGRRTVSSALRAMGLDQEKRFHRYHRVLSRASWSSREAGRVLLGLLVEAFVPEGPLVVGIDETLERRWGKKIAAKGVYRDPVRSTHENFVKSSGLRWVCVMLLVPIPWAGRVWAALHQKSGSNTRGGSSLLNKLPLLVVACNFGAKPVWALPFLSALAPSERYTAE